MYEYHPSAAEEALVNMVAGEVGLTSGEYIEQFLFSALTQLRTTVYAQRSSLLLVQAKEALENGQTFTVVLDQAGLPVRAE